jgi:hypothetical protein
MKSIISSAAAVLMVALCLGVANASGPIGIYALVDKVAFEPNADKPERIRISGVFSVAEETADNSTVYSAPQRGYLYFGLPSLPSGDQELARREWADLKSVAGRVRLWDLEPVGARRPASDNRMKTRRLPMTIRLQTAWSK